MSSSDPPQLRLSLSQSASTFKRSFDQFGFDLDSPLDSTAVASSSGTDEHRPGPSNGDRNKRARSSSVNPNSTEQPHVVDTPPSSSSSHTLSSASSNQVVVNHRDAPPAPPATRHPQAPGSDPFFPSSLGGELNHTSSELFDARGLDVLPVDPPTTSVWSSQLSSANASIEQNDQFRISMERFHAFDSQISSIRSRPSPLPFRVPANPSTLPPLTLSSPIERSHSHISPPVSLPSVESLSYTSPSAQASAPAPPSTAPPSSISPDQYHPDMSRFEEFGEFREMMGFFQGGHPNSPNIDRPSVRRRHQSPDNSDMPRIPPFRRFTSRHITENVSRNSATHMWSSDHRGTVPDDSDEDLGSRPVVTTMLEDRGPLDLPRPHHDPPQPANRLRRSMETQAPHLSFGRVSPPLFPPAMPPSQGEPNSTSYPVNGPRTQEPGRSNRNEPWSIHHPSRLPVFAEAVRTLTGRLGRPRQRTSYAGESRAERSRSPGASTLSSSMLSPTRYDVPSGYPELRSSEHSPYELDLATPSPWFNEDNHTSRPSIPSSRVHREIPTSRQVPWRSSLPSNETSEDRFLTYLSFLQRPSVTASPGDVTQPDPVWRRPSYTNLHSPHSSSIRSSSSRGEGANNTPFTRALRVAEPNSHPIESGRGWWRNAPHAETNYGPGSTLNSSGLLNDRPQEERSSSSMRDFIGRQHHPQPPSHIPPHDLNMRRSSEVYQSMPPPPPEIGGIIDADVFRPDESSEVPFSSHAAALFASRATSTMESTSQRRPDPVGRDRISDLSYYPWESRFEENFAFSARRHRANAGERRHRNSPEPERSSSIRRLTVAEPPTPSAPATRTLDIEEFQHGPFRATLERLERQGRQDQQMMMERQAEIDRLRSRLDELQSQERPVPSSRAPTLPPLRLDFELSSEAPQRMPSPTHPDSGEASSSFRAYLEAAHRRRSWQRGRATRPPSGDEPVAWRDSSGPTSSTASLPISRARSPPHAFPESRNIPPAVERERERRRRPGALELWSPGEADDAMDSLRTSSGADGSFITRSFARMRGEFQNMEGQQPRREPRGNAPWGMDSGRLALREPHVDALRGVRPLWATHAPDPWGTEMRDEILAAGSSATDAPVRGRRRRANQSTVPPQGRNVSEDERPAGGRRAFSTSRYAAARRVIHDPVFDRVQRIVRGSPREGGLFGRYGRRNAGDFIRDEDFDASYESLLSLAATIGDVRPRHTPDHVINSLPTATFKEWRNAESDQRCPICLDDYQEDDPVMRLSDCPHWLHKSCLQQWLRGATTCPVCRQRVRCPQPARRDRGARADPQAGSSHGGGGDRRGLDLAREIRDHVRIAFSDFEPVSRSDAGPNGNGSEVGRGIEQEDGDVVDMWELIGG